MSISEGPAAEPAEPLGTPLVLPSPSTLRVTWGLVGVNVAVFLLETWWGGSEWSPTLYRMGAMTGREALVSEPWRLLSSAFLHIGVVHLLLNMWALYVFGHFLEALLGPARLLALYAAAAAGGGLASSLTHERSLAAGASGAVWGLMVAEVVLLLRPRVLFDDVVFHVDKWSLLQPLVLNVFISLQPGIDLMAHLGGGVTGGLVMASGVLARAGDRAWRPAAWVAGTLMAGCIALAFTHSRPWELRTPVLELRDLPGTPIAVPVPRGLPMEAKDGTVFFGTLRLDPLVVACKLTRTEAPLATAEQRSAVETMVKEAAAQPLEQGIRPERPPEVVVLGGRPAYHDAVRNERNDARTERWFVAEGHHALWLAVTTGPDAPAPWPDVPEQIARGVVFRPERPGATAPVPSAPNPPPSLPSAGAPRPR